MHLLHVLSISRCICICICIWRWQSTYWELRGASTWRRAAEGRRLGRRSLWNCVCVCVSVCVCVWERERERERWRPLGQRRTEWRGRARQATRSALTTASSPVCSRHACEHTRQRVHVHVCVCVCVCVYVYMICALSCNQNIGTQQRKNYLQGEFFYFTILKLRNLLSFGL